jgi:DNA-binding CsgD family transcriptional regulator
MHGLPEATMRQLLSAVDRLSEVGSVDAFPMAAIEAIDLVVRSEVTTFNLIDPGRARMIVDSRPAIEYSPEAYALMERDPQGHPLVANFLATGDGTAHAISELLTVEQFHATQLYDLVFGPLGIEDQMAISLPAVRPVMVGLAVNRCARDFSDADRDAMNALRPILGQQYRLLCERERLQSLFDTARDAMADNQGRLVVLDEIGDEASDSSGLLASFFGAPPRPGALPSAMEIWLERERSKRAARSEGGDPTEPLEPLVVERRGERLLARFVPGDVEPDAIVLHHHRVEEPSVDSLLALALSPREADIMHLVITGATNAAIGAKLFISPGTVKKHLDNIYRKLGVRGRAAAVATALDLWSSAVPSER